MDRFAYDPFRLHHRPGPAPVDGDLPPPLRLVDDEDLEDRGRPVWLRGMAALVVAVFALATILAAGSGAASLLAGGIMVPAPEGAP